MPKRSRTTKDFSETCKAGRHAMCLKVDAVLTVHVATKTLALCSIDNGSQFAVFPRSALTFHDDDKPIDEDVYNDVMTAAGRLLHYLFSRGKINDCPCTVEDLMKALKVYLRLFNVRYGYLKNKPGLGYVICQVDDSIREFIHVNAGKTELCPSDYELWWMAPVVERIEGMHAKICDCIDWMDDEADIV